MRPWTTLHRPRRFLGLALGMSLALAAVLACRETGGPSGAPTAEEASAGPRRGGRLVAPLGSEPKTLNPILASDADSLSVIQPMNADLIHIDRASQETRPALAERWTADDGGRRYTLTLRPGLRFSDGHPASADDVVFSFQAYLDERVESPQRDLLIVGGEPIRVRKVDDHTVEFRLAQPYAAAERLFDGFAILPRHLLAESYEKGTLTEAWGLDTPPGRMAGLGPFRLRERRPGERLVLERNPYYWKKGEDGASLPYLDELTFLIVPSQDAQLARFQAAEVDLVDRLSPESFDLLSRDAKRRGWQLWDLGPGLDINFLFFNLNDLDGRDLPVVRRRQEWFRETGFRRAVSTAIDRDAIVRLVYRGRAAPLASHESPGSRRWVHAGLRPPPQSLGEARRWLRQAGFSWDAGGSLRDRRGQRVELTLLLVANSAERGSMATLIQEDLRQLGMDVRIAALDLQAVIGHLFDSWDYDACLIALDGGDADPNPSMGLLLSDGGQHLWRLDGKGPAAPWEEEIDSLMRQQLVETDPVRRKKIYDRVQEIVAEQNPLIPLVSPDVLVAAREGLGNLRPAVLEDHLLWNVDELYWRNR